MRYRDELREPVAFEWIRVAAAAIVVALAIAGMLWLMLVILGAGCAAVGAALDRAVRWVRRV